jgi:hypothetical protein
MSLSGMRRQLGQSMIEYCVVVTFGVLTLTTGPMKDVIIEIIGTIKNKFEGYSYAISLSDTPDADNSAELRTWLESRGVPPDQAAYLAQNPFDLMAMLEQYNIPSIPDLQEGLDQIEEQTGLSPSDFLEGLSPF